MSDWDVVVSLFKIFAFGSAGYCAGIILKFIIQRISPKITGLEYFSYIFLILGSHYGLMNLVIDLQFAGLLPNWLSMLLWAEIYIVGGTAVGIATMFLVILPILYALGVVVFASNKIAEHGPVKAFLEYVSINRHISIPIICLIAVMMLYYFR